MPTSPRDLTGGTGWYQPTALLSNPRADEGHRPLRVWEVFATQPGPSYVFRCPLHTRPCGATLSKQERAGDFPLGRHRVGYYRLLVMLPIGYFSRGFFHRLLHSCGKGLWGRGYPQKYSTALLQAVEYFSRFPRKLRRQGRGERLLIRVILFLFVLYSILSTVISWFSTKFIHSCGYSCG